MKTEPNDTAYPYSPTSEHGLTKRELFAMEFAKAYIQAKYPAPLAAGLSAADNLILLLNEKGK